MCANEDFCLIDDFWKSGVSKNCMCNFDPRLISGNWPFIMYMGEILSLNPLHFNIKIDHVKHLWSFTKMHHIGCLPLFAMLCSEGRRQTVWTTHITGIEISHCETSVSFMKNAHEYVWIYIIFLVAKHFHLNYNMVTTANAYLYSSYARMY